MKVNIAVTLAIFADYFSNSTGSLPLFSLTLTLICVLTRQRLGSNHHGNLQITSQKVKVQEEYILQHINELLMKAYVRSGRSSEERAWKSTDGGCYSKTSRIDLGEVRRHNLCFNSLKACMVDLMSCVLHEALVRYVI